MSTNPPETIPEKFARAWRQSEGRSLVYRLGYIAWLVAKGLAGRVYYGLYRLAHRALGLKRRVQRAVFLDVYSFVSKWFFRFVYPVNYLLSVMCKGIKYENSVLHISYMVHIPYYTVKLLRKHGFRADYLAVGGKSPWWDKYDYHFPSRWPPTPWGEFLFFWRVVSRYEVIHTHFGVMLSRTGWELPILKKLGRKIVLHYRGCEIRDAELNKKLHPEVNICQVCDYDGSVCQEGRRRCVPVEEYADAYLVTTPDMKDFAPAAVHFPFLTPEIDYAEYAAQSEAREGREGVKIVHVTNHPGIEGTEEIKGTIERLRARGHKIDFVFLRGVTPERALREYRDADLSIGKMKMGYYANAQIESMFLGVPAITHVRPEFVTPALESSGFILSSLRDLETTLEYYLTHPEALEAKRRIARSSILSLHDNDQLAQQMKELYASL